MAYSVSHFDDIQKIPEEVKQYLDQHPAINFETIGILEQLSENPKAFDGILECIVASKARQIQVITCRIRPYNLLISHSLNSKSISSIVEYFQKSDVSLPGIYGPAEEVKQFTKIWKDLSGEDFKSSDEFLQYSLKTMKMSAQFIGDISIATKKQEKLLKGWTEESVREIIPSSTDEFVKSCTKSFLKLLENDKVFILEEEGLLVSMATISGQTKTMQAINDVYTPPEYRGKGYATELCIFLCDYILDYCKNTPILWVKTTNYAAIHIYEKIGFEQVAKMELCLK